MELLSGNEAIARGAWEAGATIGVAYPGTPSTETMESFARYEGVYAEWCTNEKVAVEVGVGHAAADIQGSMRKNIVFPEYDREIITLLKAEIPPLLRR